jgi:hypothetical protein
MENYEWRISKVENEIRVFLIKSEIVTPEK